VPLRLPQILHGIDWDRNRPCRCKGGDQPPGKVDEEEGRTGCCITLCLILQWTATCTGILRAAVIKLLQKKVQCCRNIGAFQNEKEIKALEILFFFYVCVTVYRGYNNINYQIDAKITNFIDNYNQLNMFRAIISPIHRSTRLCLQLVV